MPEDITVDKGKFDTLLLKIARSKPTSQGQIKTMMASAKARKPKKQQPKDTKKQNKPS